MALSAGTRLGHYDVTTLEELERQLADRMFLLIEDAFRMGATHECRGYDASVVRSRMPPVLELTELIRVSQQKQREQ